MILFLYGKDTFRSRAHLRKMMAKFTADRDPQGLNVARVDCAKEPEKLMEQMLATPFLAEKRMVVVENLLAEKQKELQGEILKRIEDGALPDTNVVVFWEANDTFKTKEAKLLFERLQKEKFSQKFDVLKGVQLGGWIAAEVKERGGSIQSQAIQYMVQHVGEDVWQLNSLIDQLIAFVSMRHCEEQGDVAISSKQKDPSPTLPYKGREVVLADVKLFLDETADDSIFNLVDAIVAKQPKKAYAMIQQQYRIGEDVQFIFAMLLRQFRILLEMRDVFEREDAVPSNVLAKKLGLHPFVVKKSLPLVKRYTLSQLKDVYGNLLDLDRQIKSGQANQEVLLDVFVGKVCV